MLDFKDLNDYLNLPTEFKAEIDPLIESALDDFFECRSYVRCALEYYGDNAFKNPRAYQDVEYDILNMELPRNFVAKLLAVVRLMKKENCNEEYTH